MPRTHPSIIHDRDVRENASGLEIDFLGSPVVRSEGQELSIVSRKSAALLYYLAAHPSRAHSRSHLVALLWEESDEAMGRNSLSTALSRLRRVLPFPIRRAGDTLVWDPVPDTDTDLAQFERLITSDQDANEPRELEAAVALYRGPFLSSFEIPDSAGFEEWLRQEREYWQQRVLGVYRRLIAMNQRSGLTAAAIDAAQRALAIDPIQEPLYRTLMRLHCQAGDRASAIGEFLACERVLREVLDVDPAPETRALRDAIAQGPLPLAPLSPAPSPSRGRGGPTRPRYPLVGRETEFQQLWRVLETTRDQRSRLIVVEGEAGIGKTRLIEEVLSRLADVEQPAAPLRSGAQWTIFLGHSYQDAQGLPYHPIIEALRSQPAILDAKRLNLSDIWLAEINRLLPEIGAQRGQLPTPVRLDPQQERRRLFEGITRLLAALEPPRVFVLEDLHWADSETLHLLAYLVRHEALYDTLFVATLRSEDMMDGLARILDSLEYEGWLDRVVVPPLSAAMTVELVQAIVQGQATALAEQAYREAEGNPLFTVELVRSLLEKGIWQPDRQLPQLERIDLPPTVQAVIRSRLARLDPASRELLNSAAIFRRAFDFDEVRDVAGQRDEVAVEALETLLRMHLLRETMRPVAAGVVATLYRFGHDQVRRVVYDGLSDARRRLLHRRAFDVLAPSSERHAEELAYHAVRSQSWSLALEWSERSAADALRLHAYASAMHLYEQALACVVQLPPSRELRQRAIDVRIRLAQAAFYVQPGRLLDWLAQAEAEASRLEDGDRLARVRLAQASALYILGYFTTALPRLEQLHVMAASAQDRSLEAQTDNILGRLLVIRGELGRGLALLESALRAAEPGSGPIWSPTPLERITSVGLAAAACAFRGQFAEATTWLRRCRQVPSVTTDAAMQAAEAFYHALIAHTRADWPATVAHATEAITNARSAGNLIYEYVAHVYLGPALAHQGRPEEGLTVQRAAIALADRAHTRVILGRAYAYLAEILLLADQPAAAHEAARQGLALAEEHGHVLEAAIGARVLGEICTAQGDWDEGMAALEHARAALAALEAWPERARADAALGQLYVARGDGDKGREHLAWVVQRFLEMDLAWDLAQARLVLSAS